MQIHQQSIILHLLTLIAAAGLLIGCKTGPGAKDTTKERDQAVSALDQMYAKYLSGTIMDARLNMLKAIAFIHDNSERIPELKGALPVSYARLSLLERKAGHEALSRIYFEKSRYWRIVEQEKLQLKPEEIISNYDFVTRDESDKYALEWDKKWTKGVGPAYLNGLSK
jgi:hypothetical protein